MTTSISVMATLDGGVLYPAQPLPLAPHQRVALIVQVPEAAETGPENVAEMCQELAEEDRRLAGDMFPTVRDKVRMNTVQSTAVGG